MDQFNPPVIQQIPNKMLDGNPQSPGDMVIKEHQLLGIEGRESNPVGRAPVRRRLVRQRAPSHEALQVLLLADRLGPLLVAGIKVGGRRHLLLLLCSGRLLRHRDLAGTRASCHGVVVAERRNGYRSRCSFTECSRKEKGQMAFTSRKWN